MVGILITRYCVRYYHVKIEMIAILFLVAFIILIYFFFYTRQPVIIYEEPVPVSWWPWSITAYNWWPYWGVGGGGSSNVIHYREPRRHHESGDTRPWGGASRHANVSAPSGHSGPRGGPRGGH